MKAPLPILLTCLTAILTPLQSAAGAAPSPPDAIIWETLVRINAFGDNPDDPTDRPPLVRTPPRGTLRQLDISHDGKPDWLVDFQPAGVVGECGTGGCTKIIYVSTEDGYVRAFEQQAFSLTVREVGGETRLEAWVHDLRCTPETADCRYAWSWDAGTRRLQARTTSTGVSLLASGGQSPVTLRPDQAPPALEGWASAQGRVCLVDYGRGYDVREAQLTPVRDVNGDGLDDWLALPPAPCDADASPPAGLTLWTTNPAGAVSLAYAAAPEATLSIDIAVRPARVLETAACGADETCNVRRLDWRPADRVFVRPQP